MAKRQKKRGSRTDRLLGAVYKSTVMAVMEAEPGGKAERLWDEQVAAAERAGIPQRKTEAMVKRAVKDAVTIGELLNEMPDALVKLSNDGFEIVGGGEA